MGEYQASEQDIRHTMLLSIKRIDEDGIEKIESLRSKINDKRELHKEYSNIYKSKSGDIYRLKKMQRLWKETIDHLEERLNNLNERHTSWIKTMNLFTPLAKAKTLTEITDFLNEDLAWFIQRGLKLLQSDFTYRRNFSGDKPDIAVPEYIEKIIDEYDKYGLHEEEYLEVTYWLNIIATKKWLISLHLQDKEKSYQTGRNELTDNNIHVERERIKKYRDEVFQYVVKMIKLIYDSPDKTFVSVTKERLEFIKEYKHSFIDNSIKYFSWFIYERPSYTVDGESSKGLSTYELIKDFQDDLDHHLEVMILLNTNRTTIEHFIESTTNLPPEQAIERLEYVLNVIKKRVIMESHSFFQDDYADWRAYNIKLITQEIEFQKKRLEIKASGKSDGTSDNATKEEPSISFTEYMQSQNDLTGEKEVYRVASEHEPGETWPDSIFEELFEIQKRTGETNLKVSERFCENAGIIEQARALKKAWIDHKSSKNKKGTIQAQSRHDSDTIQTRNHI